MHGTHNLMQARMKRMLGQVTSEGFGSIVRVGSLMSHGGMKQIRHMNGLEKMKRMLGRATH